MEIIHLILGKANPERMNGVNKVVYQLATHQASGGREVAVWGITKDPEHNYGKRNFDTKLFPKERSAFRFHSSLREAIIAKKGNAIFHLHGGWIPVYFPLSRFLSKNSIPFVLTPHGAYNKIAMEKNKWIKRLYFHFFEKALLRRCMRIHSIGNSEVGGLKNLYKADKSFLLPYGFEPLTPKASHHVNSEFIIGYVGRLDIYTKGLDLLIDAFNEFQKSYPTSRLWVIGDGPERRKLEQMARACHLSNVTFWGSKFGQEKEELMNQMNIFAHPSRNEGLPTAVLEASSLGIPCVVSKATNVSDVIDEYQAGKTIEDNDAHGLIQAFEELYQEYDSRNLSKLSLNARKMVEDKFSWQTLISQFDELYHIEHGSSEK